MRTGALRSCLAGLVAVTITASLAVSAAGGRTVRAHATAAPQCRDPYSSQRDPSNPLMLSNAPGADPLSGARFFVNGPRHGSAAGAIASMLGVDPTSYADNYSWVRFKHDLDSGRLHNKLSGHPGLSHKVDLLEKIASEPEAQRFSAYSQGGGPGAIYSQVQKVFCHNLTADPGTVPIISTYFLHAAAGGCPSPSELAAIGPVFRRRIDEMAAGTGNRPAVYLLELDAFGSSSCMARVGDLPQWEADVRYETDKISALPHTVVYVEAGYSDANSAGYTARALTASGISRIRGFFTNDTHINWTINEVRWAEQVSRKTHGAHFIVNTAQNGRGPKLNPHPVSQGSEDLCNPPGRGLGPQPTTDPGFPNADALLWTHVPGNSSGHCHGGPDPGTFWPARAIALATHANDRMGPGFASDPY